jgi:hypothetical protein
MIFDQAGELRSKLQRSSIREQWFAEFIEIEPHSLGASTTTGAD